jgi:hypothetical protein
MPDRRYAMMSEPAERVTAVTRSGENFHGMRWPAGPSSTGESMMVRGRVCRMTVHFSEKAKQKRTNL